MPAFTIVIKPTPIFNCVCAVCLQSIPPASTNYTFTTQDHNRVHFVQFVGRMYTVCGVHFVAWFVAFSNL